MSLRLLKQLVFPRGRTPYRDAHYLAATVQIDPTAMRRFLPRSLRLATPYRAELFTAYFPDQTYTGPYREAGLFVHIKAGRGTGVHCPWMVVDDDRALILGREATGYPKKLADITWDHYAGPEGDRITAHAARRGSDLVHMNAELGGPDPDAPPILGRPHRNVTGLLGASFPRIVAFKPGERPIQTRHATIDLTLGEELQRMGLGPIVCGRLHRVDLTPGAPPLPLRPVSPLFAVRTLTTRVL